MNFENMLLHEITFDLDFSIRYHKHKHINIKLTNYKIEWKPNILITENIFLIVFLSSLCTVVFIRTFN